ncbi:MAG: GlsB/YeaQ/YmgE family stress response membrane protein [Planctomycetaceae bacterium]|nr:GlsB/YeaQ/YmgE family stress response membrane protein [Planctomycetaceae bacterium]
MFSKIIVWLILGALAGSIAGRVATLSKTGFGRWLNLAFGMLGAVVGGFLFSLFGINLGLGELKITAEDVISAFLGSLLCIGVWLLIRRRMKRHSPETPTA